MHVDLAHKARLEQQPLRGRRVERGQRCAGQVAEAAELEYPDEGHGPRRTAGEDPHPVTGPVSGLCRGHRVDCHLAWRAWAAARGQAQWRQVGNRMPRDADRRRARVRDDLAVAANDSGVAGHAWQQLSYAWGSPDPAEQAFGYGAAVGLALLPGKCRPAAPHDVGALSLLGY